MNYDIRTIELKERSDEVGTREKCLQGISFFGEN
jgi:hypothetical protein